MNMFPERDFPADLSALGRSARKPWQTGEGAANRWGIVAAVAVHAAAVWFILHMTSKPQSVVPPKPIMVSMIQAAKPPEPMIVPPKPKPVVKPQPKRAVEVPRPVPVTQPAPVQTETLIAAAAPTSSPVREVPAAAPPAPPVEAPPPPPAPVIEPRFDVDYLNNPAPAYPAVSRRLGEQGRVLLRVHVDEKGLPTTVTLRTSSGHDRLDNVALETVRRWKFVPARKGETSVSAWVIVPIVFNLRS